MGVVASSPPPPTRLDDISSLKEEQKNSAQGFSPLQRGSSYHHSAPSGQLTGVAPSSNSKQHMVDFSL